MSQSIHPRDAIVQTAVRLFRRQGYAATGLNQLVSESGAPKGSLYHYFPDGKLAIAAAAVAAAGQRVQDTLQQLATEAATPGDLLRNYAALLAGWMRASDHRDGCPITTTLLETVPQEEAVRAAGEKALADWAAVLAQPLLARGVAQAQALRLANLAVAAIEGALLQMRVQRSAQPLTDAAEVVAGLFDAAVEQAGGN